MFCRLGLSCHLRLSARKPKHHGYPIELRTLGDHLRKRRIDLGLRQSDVADRIGVWAQTVNYWENNHFNPEVRYVPRIIAFLGYDLFGPSLATFPLQLRAARVAGGLTRRQLAARIGVHPGTVAEWERGEAQPLEPPKKQLSVLFGQSVGQATGARRVAQRKPQG